MLADPVSVSTFSDCCYLTFSKGLSECEALIIHAEIKASKVRSGEKVTQSKERISFGRSAVLQLVTTETPKRDILFF